MLQATSAAFKGILAEECDNMENNIFIAGKHSITQAEYETMIKAFFPTVPPTTSMKERIFSDSELASSCETNVVRFEFAAAQDDNNDIVLTIEPHVEDDNPNDPLVGRYSIHLFRALKHLYTPDKYLFCKARTTYQGQIVVTLVVAAVKGTTVRYYGNLTHMYP